MSNSSESFQTPKPATETAQDRQLATDLYKGLAEAGEEVRDEQKAVDTRKAEGMLNASSDPNGNTNNT